MTKKMLWIVLLVGLVLLPTSTDTQTNTTTRVYIAYDVDAAGITVDDTVDTFTAAKVTPAQPLLGAQRVTFSIECVGGGTTCPIRFWYSGATPTAAQGIRANYGEVWIIYGYPNIFNFKAIREGATSAILMTSYER